MTIISEKLAGAGYLPHFIGKWHVSPTPTLPRSNNWTCLLHIACVIMCRCQVGMATVAQTPKGRGFETSLGCKPLVLNQGPLICPHSTSIAPSLPLNYSQVTFQLALVHP